MGKIPTLISQGFSSELSTMSPPHQYLAPATMSVEKTREIREILIKASKTPAVKSAYAIDQCQPFEMSEPQLQSWYQLQTSKWKTLTTGVKVK
jgi:tripartite-type tricarboxylate transporter receptor subunit TctC